MVEEEHAAGSGSLPNLVFIFSDQQARDMVGAYGVGQAQTPHLDSLASTGILFDHAVSNSPVCTPARSMIISGQHPLRNNCFDNDRRLLTDIGPSFARVLNDFGYRNAYVGKWHLYGGDRDRPIPPGPDRHGFDELFLSNNCHVNYDPENAFFFDGDRKQLFGAWEVAGQTQQAVDFLSQVDSSDRFSLFLSYHAPHNHTGGDVEAYSMYDAPEEFKALYQPDELRPRPTVPNNTRTRRMMQGYLGLCSEVDDAVGEVLRTLQERGLADNTIVVYTSDHGETFGAYNNHWHKGSPEDVSVRVPLIMRLPGGVGGVRRSQLLIGTLDLMPTLLGLMGLPVPHQCQGRDLSTAIRDQDDDAVKSVPLFYFSTPWRGVYTRRWTYSVENIDRSSGAAPAGSDIGRTVLLRRLDTLYDRDEDPDQLYNLYGHRSAPGIGGHEQVSEDLHALTLEWLDRFDDPFLDQTELAAVVDARDGRAVDAIRLLKKRRDAPGQPVTR